MACRTRAIDPTASTTSQRRGRDAGRRGSNGPRRNGARACAAFTLAESLIASVVLAVAVIGVATTIAASHQQTGTLETSAAAVCIARQLMEEIAARPYLAAADDTTPGWAGGQADRMYYDSVRDYHGLSETTPVNTLDGEKIHVGSDEFVRKVKITYPTTLFGTTAPAGEFAVIEVTVEGIGGTQCTLKRLVARTARER